MVEKLVRRTETIIRDRSNENKIDPKTKAKVVRFIRLLFRQSEQYKIAKERAVHPTIKGPRGGKMYQCAICKKAFKASEVIADHIDPVVPIGVKQKDMTIDQYVARLYCSPNNLQIIDVACHKIKTKEERQ